jgi:hypothetical protein
MKDDAEPHSMEVGILGKIEYKVKKFANEVGPVEITAEEFYKRIKQNVR